MKFILSNSFNKIKKFEKEFLSDIIFNKIKTSPLKNKSSALILINLAEFFHMLKDYERSQIYYNISNIYFNIYDKEDILYLKNLSYICLNNYFIIKKVKN
jgi:hypothetical protein